MTKQLLVVFLLLIPLFSFGQDFKLFKSKKEKGEYVANSFWNYEYEIVNEQIMHSVGQNRLVKFDVFEKDSMELYLIENDQISYYSDKTDVTEIMLVTKPNELEKHSFEEYTDTIEYAIKGTNETWELIDTQKSKCSSSWIKREKELDVYEGISKRKKRIRINAVPSEIDTFYYLKNNSSFSSVEKQKIIYYKFIRTESRVSDYPIPFEIAIKPALTHLTQIYSVKTISNKQAKKLLPKIKGKLKSLNYYQGKINKKIDNEFIISMTNYQKDNQLPIGQFDYETLSALGLQ